jgi:hypothetical protein
MFRISIESPNGGSLEISNNRNPQRVIDMAVRASEEGFKLTIIQERPVEITMEDLGQAVDDQFVDEYQLDPSLKKKRVRRNRRERF